MLRTKSDQLLLAFLTVFCLLGSQAGFAAELCEIKQVESKSLSHRSRVLKFPDGRTITVIGHNHGDREYPLELSKLTRSDSAEVSNEQFEERVKKLVTSNRVAVQNANEDLEYLRSVLVKNQEIKFVGYEGTQESADENLKWMDALHKRYYSQVWKRSLDSTFYNRNAILLATGATTYLKLTEPGLFRNRKIVGLESDQASSIYDIALDEFEVAGDELKKLAQGDSAFLEKISDTYSELFALYSIYEPVKHDQLVIAAAKKNIPDKYLGAGLKWIRAGLKEMAAMKGRDRAIVQNMISSGESGILFIGWWHLDSVANMVRAKCLALPGAPEETGVSEIGDGDKAVE